MQIVAQIYIHVLYTYFSTCLLKVSQTVKALGKNMPPAHVATIRKSFYYLNQTVEA